MFLIMFLAGQSLAHAYFTPAHIWIATIAGSPLFAFRASDEANDDAAVTLMAGQETNGQNVLADAQPPWNDPECGPLSTCKPHGVREVHQNKDFPQISWNESVSKIKTGDAILYGGIGPGSDRIRAGSCAKSISHIGIAAVFEKKSYSDGSYYWELVAGPVVNKTTQVLTAMEVANHAAPDLISGDTGGGFQIIPLLWKIGSIIPGSCNCRITILPLKGSLMNQAKLKKLETISSCLRIMRMRYQLKDLIRLFMGAYGGLSRSEWALEAMYCSEFTAAVGVEMGWVDLSQLRNESQDRQTCELPAMAKRIMLGVNTAITVTRSETPLGSYGPSPENVVPVAMMDPRVAVGYNVGDGFDIDLSSASEENANDEMGGPFRRLEAAGESTNGYVAPVITARELRDRQICDSTAVATAGFQNSLGNAGDPQNTLPRTNVEKRLKFNRNVLMFFEGEVWYVSAGKKRKLTQAPCAKRHLRVFLHVGRKRAEVGLSIPQKARRVYGEGAMQAVRMGAPEWLPPMFRFLNGIEVDENGDVHDSYFEKAPWSTLMSGQNYRPLFSATYRDKHGQTPSPIDHLKESISQASNCGDKNLSSLDLHVDYGRVKKRSFMRLAFNSILERDFVLNLLENLRIAMKRSHFGENGTEARQTVFEGVMAQYSPSAIHSILSKQPPSGEMPLSSFLFQRRKNGLPNVH